MVNAITGSYALSRQLRALPTVRFSSVTTVSFTASANNRIASSPFRARAVAAARCGGGRMVERSAHLVGDVRRMCRSDSGSWSLPHRLR